MLAEETIELLFNHAFNSGHLPDRSTHRGQNEKNDKHSNKLGHNGKQHSLPDYIVALPD